MKTGKTTCPRCGTPLAGVSPEGLCSRCVQKAVFGGLKAFDADLEPIITESDSGNSEPLRDDAVGEMIGRYKLREMIGEGGCGVVYVAEQLEPVRRKVALKLIKLGMDTKAVVARFEAERQALAMMDHPNIAKVLEAGATENGRPYFVMELVRGIKITDYCDQNNLSTTERINLFVRVCQAVQHAHQKGIIHRDLKPSNILVTLHDGQPVPKVIDFGIAKATEGRLTEATIYTQLHQFIGTPAYISPEQAEMSGLDIDTRSDIYSLGVLLYELLTGATPFDGEQLISMGLDAMRKTIREKEPARPSAKLSTLGGEERTTTAQRRSVDSSKLFDQLRGDMDWIVMKCLEKDRTRRYETANALSADLKRHLKNEPVIARPPSSIYQFQKAWKRNKVVYASVATVITALLIGLIATLWSLTEANRLQTIAESERDSAKKAHLAADAAKQTAIDAREETARHAEASERKVYLNHIANADQALLNGDIARARFELTQCTVPHRNWEWAFLQERIATILPLQFAGRNKPAFSRDRRRVFAPGLSDQDQILFWDTESGELLGDLTHDQKTLVDVALSPDEYRLAGASNDGSLMAWDLQSKKKIWTVNASDRFDGIAYSPDGRLIATANWDHTLKLFDATDGHVIHSLSFANQVRGVAFSAGGEWLAAGIRAINEPEPVEHPVLVEVDSGKVIGRFAEDGARVVVFSPDGKWLATGNVNGSVSLWSWDGQNLTKAHSWIAAKSEINALAFSPNSARLVSAAARKATIWQIHPLEEVASCTDGGLIYWVTYPSESRVTFYEYGRGNRLWDLDKRDTSVVQHPHQTEVFSVVFSPDSRWIGVGAKSTGINVLEAASGKTINAFEWADWQTAWIDDGLALIDTRQEEETLSLAIHSALTGESIKSFRHEKNGGKFSRLTEESTLQIWDLNTRQRERQINLPLTSDTHVTGFSLGRLSRRVAMALSQGTTVHVWDTATQSDAHQVQAPGGGWISALLFSADREHLYVGAQRGHLALYAVETGEQLRTFKETLGQVTALALSHDETQLVCGDSEGRVLVWDVENAMPLVTLADAPHIGVTSLDWSPDDRRIAAGKADGSVQIWTLPTAPGLLGE